MGIVIGLLFGAVGGVYLAYGRRLHEPAFLVCGVLLMIYPYFFDSIVLMLLVGAAIAVYPVGRLRGWF